jgi:hypothetical protein
MDGGSADKSHTQEKQLVELGEAIVRFDWSRTGICEDNHPDAKHLYSLSIEL